MSAVYSNYCCPSPASVTGTQAACIAGISLVAFVSIALCGFAQMRYLPAWTHKMGITLLLSDCAVAGVLLAVRFFKQSCKKPASAKTFDARWVTICPDDVKKIFFAYLSLQDLARMQLVCKQWKEVIQTHFKPLQKFVESQDWCEDKPNYKIACDALLSFGKKRKPKLIRINTGARIYYDCAASGNHFVCCITKANESFVQVWRVGSQVQNAELKLRAERRFTPINTPVGYYGEKVYKCIGNNSVAIWDLKTNTCETWKNVHNGGYLNRIVITSARIVTASDDGYKLWTREDRTLLRQLNSKEDAVAVNDLFHRPRSATTAVLNYKNRIIDCRFLGNYISIFSVIASRDPIKIPATEEVIYKNKKAINRMKISGRFLLVERGGIRSSILIFDLEKKKQVNEMSWLTPFDPFSFMNAFSGMVITKQADELQIWDYR